MIHARTRYSDSSQAVVQATKRGSVTALRKAGALIRGIAMRSIRVAPDPAPAGHQPHSRTGRLKAAIYFAVERDLSDVVIGPSASAVGKIGRTHELGGVEPPKKPPVLRKHNWILKVGGHGPMRLVMGRQLAAFGKIRTEKQLARVLAIAPEVLRRSGEWLTTRQLEHAASGAGKVRKYPARPFMNPALEIGRKRLPRMWAKSVRR